MEYFLKDNPSFSKKKHKIGCWTRLFCTQNIIFLPNQKRRFENFASESPCFSSALTYSFVCIIMIITECFLLGLMHIYFNSQTFYLFLHQLSYEKCRICGLILATRTLTALLHVELNVVVREINKTGTWSR